MKHYVDAIHSSGLHILVVQMIYLVVDVEESLPEIETIINQPIPDNCSPNQATSMHQASREHTIEISGVAGPNQRWAFIQAIERGDTSQQHCMSK